VANNPLNDIDIGQCTEACPQMRRRFRAGVAADLSVWLLMLEAQYRAQLAALPRPVDAATSHWRDQQSYYLGGMADLCGALAGRVADRWSVHEWNRAVERFTQVLTDAAAPPDTAAEQAAQAHDRRDEPGDDHAS